MKLGTKIKLARLEKNLTQIELAKMLQTNQANVSDWEKEKTPPEIASLKKLSKILDKPMFYWLAEGVRKGNGILRSNGKQVDLTNGNSIALPILINLPDTLPVFDDNDVEGNILIPKYMFPGAKYGVHCPDKSLEPEIREGELCLINDKNKPINGKIMLVNIPGKGRFIRKIVITKHGIEFQPINNSFNTMKPKHYKIIGQVIGSWRKRE